MAKKKKTTACSKAKKDVDKWKKKADAAQKRYKSAEAQAKKYAKSNKAKAAKWERATKSAKASWKNYSKKLKKSESKLNKLKKSKAKSNLSKISDKISKHKHKHTGEGNAAIYRSDGRSTDIVYIAPTDSEQGDISTTITTWAVDKGEPRYNHARQSSNQVTVGGIITGKTRAEAQAKLKKLKTWNARQYELTYRGNIYYKHLLISDLSYSYSADYKTNIKATVSFQFVYTTKITTTGKSTKKRTSKSSKTVSGSKSKKYTAITIRPGDTLSALGKKYGKSVAWLCKVNKIANPNLIYAGHKLRVR